MEIIAFIEKYWSYIAPLLLFIFEFILFICKKRNNVTFSDSSLLGEILGLIIEAENKFKRGADKKKWVIDTYKEKHPNYIALLKEQFDEPYHPFNIDSYLSTLIEYLLSTPEKKKGGPGSEEVK